MCAWRILEPEEVAFIEAVDAVLLRAVRTEELSFEEEVREYRRVEAEFVERAGENDYWAVEIRRRITEWILRRARYHHQPQEVCREIWQELLQRGFSGLDVQLNMTGIYVRCCQMNGEFDEGLALIDPQIAMLEQVLGDEATTLTPELRFDCEQSLEIDRTIRDELKAGIRE